MIKEAISTLGNNEPAIAGSSVIDLSGGGWKLWRDKDALWRNDPLFYYHEQSQSYKRYDDDSDENVAGRLSISELPYNPPTCGWIELDNKSEADVSVPGTVDEYLWGRDTNPYDNNGRYDGVSWWWREFNLPCNLPGKKLILKFEAVVYRAEVFINQTLVKYDLVSGTPFEVDATPYLKPGELNQLAVRVTNPGGSMSWDDGTALYWGDTDVTVYQERGFSGITGGVVLQVKDSIYIDYVYIRNKPSLKDIDVCITVNNTDKAFVTGTLNVKAVKVKDGTTVYEDNWSGLSIQTGRTHVIRSISIPDAEPWSPDSPNLYKCIIGLNTDSNCKDSEETTFGFRWIEVRGVGENAHIYFNNRRIRLISAISWGFWPVNGIYATRELAAKQTSQAKRLGLNMLNHHRHIGSTPTFEEADQQGLFYYEEMGGLENTVIFDSNQYTICSINKVLNRTKVLRTVKRDRNHPSVILFGFINETHIAVDEELQQNMKDAHALAPDRLFIWSSGHNFAPGAEEGKHSLAKAWMNTNDDTIHDYGWSDWHGVTNGSCYNDRMYISPSEYLCHAFDAGEAKGWGEETAVGTPARYGAIHDMYIANPDLRKGWDGDEWEIRYEKIQSFLVNTGMDKCFTVDSLTRSIGEKSFYYQGRCIENFKINDINDYYAINGWENDKASSLSGVVDIWRNLKTEKTELIKYYTGGTYIAVKPHSKVMHAGDTVITDFYAVNENSLSGMATLAVNVYTPSGSLIYETNWEISLSGGDVYSQLLLQDISIELGNEPGYYSISASLTQDGSTIATGIDKIFTVDWKSQKLPENGAILDNSGEIARFIKGNYRLELPDYSDSLGKLDYIIIGKADTGYLRSIAARVERDGTKAIFLEAIDAAGDDSKLVALSSMGVIPGYNGKSYLYDRDYATWLGGGFFAGSDPLFDGLPQNTGFNWEYQILELNACEAKAFGLRNDDGANHGMYIPGVQAVAGLLSFATEDHDEGRVNPATKFKDPSIALCSVQYGKGSLLLSTLPVLPYLNSDYPAANTAMKLFCNFIR